MNRDLARPMFTWSFGGVGRVWTTVRARVRLTQRGSVLLEVLLAVAIFATAGIAILVFLGGSLDGLRASQRRQDAADVAATAMVLLQIGAVRPETLNGSVRSAALLSAMSGAAPTTEAGVPSGSRGQLWQVSVSTEPAPFAGLTLVTVRVASPGAGQAAEFTLRQLVPLARAADVVARRDGRARWRPRRRLARGRQRVPARAFSLLEVLIAVALIAALFGGIVQFLWALTDRRTRTLGLVRHAQTLGALFDRVEQDLFTSLAGDAAHGGGLRGDSRSLTVRSRAVWLPSTGEDESAGDLQSSRISFDPVRGEVRAERWPGWGPPLGVGASEDAAPGVLAVRIRYFDGARWLEAFDSEAAGGLPVAVELSVWLAAADAVSRTSASSASLDDAIALLPSDPPDRVRVMLVPDAQLGDAQGVGSGSSGSRFGSEP
ncbi:MAG: hypothetical protein JNM07_06990 [Phycisphaerae bacterium]|nr:hypothetical protein [Phycisphaerae bacterium]